MTSPCDDHHIIRSQGAAYQFRYRMLRLRTNNNLETKETLMYRSLGIAVIALAAISFPAETSLAFGAGGRAGKSGWSMASVAPAKSGGTATPAVKKLSPKAGAACFRNCMHGVSGAGWGNFCDSACYGG
jgi:hypothetical protein